MTQQIRLTVSYWPSHEPDVLVEHTIGDLLRDVTACVPDRIGLIWGDPDPNLRRSWRYRDILQHAERLARALLESFEPGERVAVWSPNSASYVLLQRGMALAGLILVPIDPAYRFNELMYVLRQSEAAGLIHAEDYRGNNLASFAKKAGNELKSIRMIAEIEDWVASVMDQPDRILPAVLPRDAFQIQYTSGTTGFPKGALLHHMGVLNMVRYVAQRCNLRDGEVWITPMPLSHIAGGVTTQLATMLCAGTIVLMPQFNAGLLLELIESCRGTVTLAVPTMLIDMLEHPDFEARDRTSLRTIMTGAATVNADLVTRTKERFGCALTNVYGQTEMHGIVTMTSPDDTLADQTATIGTPMPHVEMKIVDPIDGKTCAIGMPGEICTRGYTTMLGYFNMPEATASTIDEQGWLHSGDLGAMDDRGYITFTGKLKDLIVRGGEKIYPREIEELLFAYPGVSNASVVGLPDKRWGEQVAAVIIATDPDAKPNIEALATYCRERLARYKTPRLWYFVERFPLTPSGKVQKFALREQIIRGEIRAAVVATSAAPK